jgi:hypothetical protein
MEGDCGGVVVNPPGVKLELFDNMQGNSKKETSCPHGDKGIQAPSYPVIIDRFYICCGETKSGRLHRSCPLCYPIQRARRQNDILYQDG